MSGQLAVAVDTDGNVVITVSEGPAFYTMHLTPADARGLAGAIASAASGLAKVAFPARGDG